MKKLILITCACLFSTVFLFAQEQRTFRKQIQHFKEVPPQRKQVVKTQEYEAPAPAQKIRFSDKVQTKKVEQKHIATRREIDSEKEH